MRFGFVGIWNFVFDYMLFGTLHFLLGLETWLANSMSYVTVLVVSFALNKSWTFGQRLKDGRTQRQFVYFCIVNLIGLGFSTGVLEVLKPFIEVWPAKLCGTAVVALTNYAIYRWLVFRP